MSNFNKVILMGNVTRDPDMSYTGTGTAVTNFGLAVNRKLKGGEEDTLFIDVTCWARTAEIANEYVQKGRPVLIEGFLKQENWEKDGERRSKISVTCTNMQLIGGREKTSKPKEAAGVEGSSEIPF